MELCEVESSVGDQETFQRALIAVARSFLFQRSVPVPSFVSAFLYLHPTPSCRELQRRTSSTQSDGGLLETRFE